MNNSIILFTLLAITLVMSCNNNLNNPEECKAKDIPVLNCEAKDIPILACKEKDIAVLKDIALNAEIPLNKLMIHDSAEIFYEHEHYFEYFKNMKNCYYGILLSSNGDIIALKLNNTRFDNLRLLSTLTELEDLNLIDNRVSELSGIENLNGLKRLYLRGNNITELDNLKNLHFLEHLDLASNKISGVINFKGLNKLKNLSLSNNEIDIIDFKGLKNLHDITVRYNSISEIKNIRASSKLASLDIYGNPIYDIKDIENLKKLKIAYIGGNIGSYMDDRNYFDNNRDKADFFIEKLKKMKVKVITSPDVFFFFDEDDFK